MDPSLSRTSRHDHQVFYWRNLIVILWALKSVTSFLPIGDAAIVAKNNRSNAITSEDYSYQQIPAPRPLLIDTRKPNDIVEGICEGCKLGENGKMCSGDDQGECDCSNSNAICRCKAEWTGDSCQYQMSKINCEKMRSCILCQVYGTGPLAEGKDCQYFCHRNYPTALIVKTLHFQEDEHLCSFIHHVVSAGLQPEECRFFFKFGPILFDGSIDSSNLYIVAQQDMDCGKPFKFPPLKPVAKNNGSFHIFAKSYEEVVRTSDIHDPGENGTRKNNFFVIVVIFVFIALPFVACAFSVIYNFSNMPCGLCNKFRQPSSKYIRNVRPFPGFIADEEVSAYFRNEERIHDSGRGNELERQTETRR